MLFPRQDSSNSPKDGGQLCAEFSTFLNEERAPLCATFSPNPRENGHLSAQHASLTQGKGAPLCATCLPMYTSGYGRVHPCTPVGMVGYTLYTRGYERDTWHIHHPGYERDTWHIHHPGCDRGVHTAGWVYTQGGRV